MDPDPTTRSTFWSYVFGLTFLWLSNVGVTPECMQRFLSVPTFDDAKRMCWMFGFGHVSLKILALMSGVLVYAKYYACDPYTIGEIKKPDQILPYYVMDIGKNIPGLAGFFIAGAFSAALSSLSSALNALSGTFYTDFLKGR